MTPTIKQIFKHVFHWKNLIFSTSLSVFLSLILGFIVPTAFLLAPLITFVEISSMALILVINFRNFDFLKKNSIENVYLWVFLITFLYAIFLILFIILQFILLIPLLKNSSFYQLGILSDPNSWIIDWSKVQWGTLFLIYSMLFILSFVVFYNLKYVKYNVYYLITFLIVTELTFGGNFLGFKIDTSTLSEYNTKSFKNPLTQNFIFYFQAINPFYWINMIMSTVFITFGSYANFNEISANSNDIVSVMQFLIPMVWIFAFIFFPYIIKYMSKRRN